MTLSYIESGNGKTVLLFVHGFCGSHEYWRNIIPDLDDEYKVIAVDIRGHGGSVTERAEFSIEELAEEIADFLDKKGIGQVFMFGHSMGGYITLALAEQYPDKLLGYSLIHSTAFPDDEKGKEGRLASAEKVKKDGVQVFVDELVPKLFAKSDDPDIEVAKKIGYGTSEAGAIGSLIAMRTRKDRNNVLQSGIPVLLVAGEEDKVVPKDKTFSAAGTYIHQEVMEGCGHMGMFEDPDRLTEIIRQFVTKYA